MQENWHGFFWLQLEEWRILEKIIIEFGSKCKVKKYKGGLSTERGERIDEISGRKMERDKRELNLEETGKSVEKIFKLREKKGLNESRNKLIYS